MLRTEILGETDPETIQSMEYLSISFLDLGRVQEALELRVKVRESVRIHFCVTLQLLAYIEALLTFGNFRCRH